MGQEPPARNFSSPKDNKYLDLVWNESTAFYARLSDRMRAVAEAFGGKYEDNPLLRFNFKQFMSAHPLGGCSMGRSIEEGVVGPTGEVFNFPGFYIADGSVMPGPVGVNPALTIAAVADRFADHMIALRAGNLWGGRSSSAAGPPTGFSQTASKYPGKAKGPIVN